MTKIIQICCGTVVKPSGSFTNLYALDTNGVVWDYNFKTGVWKSITGNAAVESARKRLARNMPQQGRRFTRSQGYQQAEFDEEEF